VDDPDDDRDRDRDDDADDEAPRDVRWMLTIMIPVSGAG
jgi:hypothetical protein